jgi:invasion protein IalB
MIRHKLASLFLAASAFTFACASAEPVAVGKFRDWSVFTEKTGSDTLCYAATQAVSKSPRKATHGDVWFYVTTWKSGAAKNQPSLKAGYEFDAGREHKARVGRSAWSLFASGREVFADDGDDAAIVSALKKGESLKVEARSQRGTDTAYSFSLSGSAAAIDKAVASCR